MKGLALPALLALLLTAPIIWRLGSPTLEAGQTEQAITDLKQNASQNGQALEVTSYTLEGVQSASGKLSEMPRVPDTAELMKIRYSDQEN